MSKGSHKMSYEAVVLAAGLGSGVTCLLGNSCKSLLPVGNKPLIYYPIRLLRAHGISNITLIVLQTYKSEVQASVQRLFPEAAGGTFDYVELREEDAMGTMEALRHYRKHKEANSRRHKGRLECAIAENIVVVSGDLVSDPDLLRLVTDVHDKRLSAATLLLSNRAPVGEAQGQQQQQPQAVTPGGKGKAKPDLDLIGLVQPPLNGPRPPATSDELADCGYVQGEQRLVYIQGEEDLGRRVPVPLAALRRFGHSVDFVRSLLDAHLYVMRRDLLLSLCDDAWAKQLTMLKGECLPLLVNERQHEDGPQLKQQLQAKDTAQQLTWPTVLAQSDAASPASAPPLAVYAHVLPASRMCLRVNRLPAYAEATRSLLKQLQQQSPPLGLNELGDGAVVKRTFIGAHCSIGAKSRLADCVLMDGATVGEDCSLANCVLCANARCEAGCSLKDCIVEAGCHVARGTSAAGEIVSEADFAA